MKAAPLILPKPFTINHQLSALRELTWDNPVLVKEFRTRMRGARAYWVLLFYVLLLALVVAGTYLSWYSRMATGGVNYQAASEVGRTLFNFLFSFQAGLVALITPAITAGAVTIEREQQTYQMLATCGLKPRHIIWGKMMAAVAFVALLLTSSLPLVSLSFLLGGVSPGEVFGTYLSLALAAFVFGSIGILCSAALRTTAAATVATYAAVILLFVVTLIFGVNPTGDAPFRSVNAATAIFHSVDLEPFFKLRLPSWWIGVTMNLLMGLLFANMAMTRLEYFDERRALVVRGLSTFLWTAYLLFLAGNMFGRTGAAWTNGAGAASDLAVWLLGLAFGLLLALLPIFATGDAEQSGRAEPSPQVIRTSGHHPISRYLAGMLPHALFRADLPAGVPLMGLWLAIAGATVAGGFAIMGRPDLLPLEVAPLLVMAAAVVAAFTGLGHLLSLTLSDRRAALVLTYLIAAACCLLPFFGFMTWEASGRSAAPHLSWQFLYLSPFPAFIELSQSSSFWTNCPPMLLGRTPFWLVTGAIYAFLATGFFTMVLARLARRKA